ncbi:transcriptional regulator, PadR-like family [Heyndrickxia coagulans 2-6]|nr:transcriptional regulator, PadR-like family [Heyndrickxia coagulans 2-6]
MRPSDSGPSRKYYELTEKGKSALDEITTEWQQIAAPVQLLLKGRSEDA